MHPGPTSHFRRDEAHAILWRSIRIGNPPSVDERALEEQIKHGSRR